MIIFECHVSNVEMCSDAFKHEPLEIEGVDSGNVFTIMSKYHLTSMNIYQNTSNPVT